MLRYVQGMEPLVYLASLIIATPTPYPVAESVQGMSDLAKTLLTAGAGVGATVIAGLVAAWIARRSEHAKWLREERLKAYTDMLAFLKNVQNVALEAGFREADLDKIHSDLDELEKRSKKRVIRKSNKLDIRRETDRLRKALDVMNEDDQVVELKQAVAVFSSTYAALVLVGPVSVSNLARNVFTVIQANYERPSGDDEEKSRRLVTAENAFINAAHKVLGVTNK